MPDCPVCRQLLHESDQACPRCGTLLKSTVKLSPAEADRLLDNSRAFFANNLEDALEMRDCLAARGFKSTLLTQDLTRLGLSLHDTHGYKLVVEDGSIEEAFDLLRKEVPRALFSELEVVLGIDIDEVMTWPLNAGFRFNLQPGITVEEFLERTVGPDRAGGLLRDRQAREVGPDAIRAEIEQALAGEDVDHDELFAKLSFASTACVDVLVDGIVRACRAGRDDVVWPAAKALKRLRATVGEAALARLHEPARDPAAEPRRYVALALGIFADPRSCAALVDLLDHADEKVRYEAIEALFNIQGQDFGYTSDGTPEERAAAVARWRAWQKTAGAQGP